MRVGLTVRHVGRDAHAARGTMRAMEHVLGQSRATRTLAAQLRCERPHHAFIFHGPVGVGKFTTAMAFARVLLCHDRQVAGETVRACGRCPSCVRLPADPPTAPDRADAPEGALSIGHPDLHVVTKELARYHEERKVRERKLRSIPVDLVRARVLEPAHHAPRLGHGKVFIVDEAELLAEAGQNAMLKTLEEPTPGTTLILVTASEHRLLPTIRSRCQRIGFGPLGDTEVAELVARHAPGAGQAEREAAVRFGRGSPGQALLAIEYGLTEWVGTVLPLLDAAVGGEPASQLGEAIGQRIDGFAKAWVDRHANASKDAATHFAAGLMWSMVQAHASGRMREAAGQASGEAWQAEARVGPWLEVIDAARETERLLGSNVNLALSCAGFAAAARRAGALTPA